MPIEIALGQINQFVEHSGAKVVILCNEKEIPEASRTTYEKTKEKVVRITRHYSGDSLEALPAIVAEFASDGRYHEFLKENHDLIVDLLRRSKLQNLRVLKYAMLVLQVAFKELSQVLPDDKAAHSGFLKVLLPVSFDLQERKISTTDAQSFLTQGSSAIFGAHLDKQDGKPKPLAAFGDRYGFGGLKNDVPKSHALAQLIETGYLDPAKLRSEIEEQKAEQTPGQKAVGALFSGWYALSDDSIKRDCCRSSARCCAQR